MANSSFLQSNKELKLIDLGDGTYAQEVTGTVSVEGLTIETLSTVSVIETLLDGTVSISTGTVNIGNSINVSNIENGTVSISNASVGISGTVTVENITIASAPAHTTYAVTSVSTTISSTSATRKFLIITNNTDTDVWVSLGTVSAVNKGICLFNYGSAYEMSAGYGNLFTGDITAIISGTVSKTIQVIEG